MTRTAIIAGEDMGEVSENNSIPHDAIWSEVGYLATWAAGSARYTTVGIYLHKDGELTATYYDAEGKITFVMHAIWRGKEEHYSTHS